MTERIPSYPKIYNLGHPAIADLLYGPVIVQEKYDGSQFSFKVSELEPTPEDPLCENQVGQVFMRSRGADIYAETADKLFASAVETVKRNIEECPERLIPGAIYRCECISKPHHNVLTYGRVPSGTLVLYDIEVQPNVFLPYDQVQVQAQALGLEPAACFFVGNGHDLGVEAFKRWMTRTSTLGATPIEGVVIKRYDAFTRDAKVMMGKFVSEAFKEIHPKSWRGNNPTHGDIMQVITDSFRTPARWHKAIIHLRESGKLQSAPQDIGPCMKLLAEDVDAECAALAQQMWWDWARSFIIRGVQRGFAEWYKLRLAESQFAATPQEGTCDIVQKETSPPSSD